MLRALAEFEIPITQGDWSMNARVLASYVLMVAVVAIAAFHPAHVSAGEDLSAAELKKMEGAWVVASSKVDGEPFDGEKGMKVTFKGDAVVMEGMGPKLSYKCKLNPAVEPRQIDFVLIEGEDKTPLLGIYRWKGEELHLLANGNEIAESKNDAGEVTRTVKAGERPKVFNEKRGIC
jgi:uncharacterized protein (TIGR03067 family)